MGERKKRGWKRTKRSITPAENNFTNVYVFDYVRCFLSVIITINISAACGKASHSELWKNLGVSRWEMAMRTSVSQLNGGFAVAPFLASYRPNAKKIKPGEKRTSTSKLGTRSYGQNGGAASEVSAKENFFVKAVPGVGESETKPQRTQVAGFSVDFF